MKENRDPKAPAAGQGEAAPKRDEEATSSETLSDLEESSKVSGSGPASESSGQLEGSTPSPRPDGGDGGRADGGDTGGPM